MIRISHAASSPKRVSSRRIQVRTCLNRRFEKSFFVVVIPNLSHGKLGAEGDSCLALATPERLWKIELRIVDSIAEELTLRRVCNRCGSVRTRSTGSHAASVGALDRRPMGSQELAAAGRVIFGERWLRPLARALQCSPALIRQCKDGRRALSGEGAARVRAMADLGPAGQLIRQVVAEVFAHARPVQTHRVATRLVLGLSKANLLAPSGMWIAPLEGRPAGAITRSPLPADSREHDIAPE